MATPTHILVKELRERAGFTMSEMASRLKMRGASSYQRYEEESTYAKRPHLTFEMAERFAAVLIGRGDPPIQPSEAHQLGGDHMMRGLSYLKDRPPVVDLPIRYKVAAGLWRETEDIHEPYGYAMTMALPGISSADQWLEEVVGDSFNMRWPEGTLLHVRSGFGMNWRARHGRRVIVERVRDGGLLRERTVKEIVVTTTGEIELWPRSFNPRWSKPIVYSDGLSDGDTVEIMGLVERAILNENTS